MTVGELSKVLADAEGALKLYELGRFTKQSKNSREGRALKRKIAIIQTLRRQKELVHE